MTMTILRVNEQLTINNYIPVSHDRYSNKENVTYYQS